MPKYICECLWRTRRGRDNCGGGSCSVASKDVFYTAYLLFREYDLAFHSETSGRVRQCGDGKGWDGKGGQSDDESNREGVHSEMGVVECR